MLLEKLCKEYFWNQTDLHLDNWKYIAIRGDIITVYKDDPDGTWKIIDASIFSSEKFQEIIVDELGIQKWNFK